MPSLVSSPLDVAIIRAMRSLGVTKVNAQNTRRVLDAVVRDRAFDESLRVALVTKGIEPTPRRLANARAAMIRDLHFKLTQMEN